MASAELRDELNCSICLNLYTDPVSLRCGHNFCRSCIEGVLDTQYESGGYSCPDCRAEYLERPDLEKNRKLGNIVERFLSTHPDMEETRIFCCYCIKSPVPAVKSCMQCEMSLCDDHLTVHSKTVDHMLTEPTGSYGNNKCSIHKKVLELYCPQDATCLCVSCLVVEHSGHQVELLDEAFKEEKKKLRKNLEELNSQKEEIYTRFHNLHDHQRNIQEKASDKRKNVSKLFMDIKVQLEMAEKKALNEISRQEEKIVSQISDLIKELYVKKDELSRKIHHLEEMCDVTDQIRLLQESDIAVYSHEDGEDTEEDGEEIKSVDVLDEVLISLNLYRSMRDIVTNVTSQLGFSVPDILMDVDTAHKFVEISEDLKTATKSEKEQDRPESSGRLGTYPQVLSRCGLSSGRFGTYPHVLSRCVLSSGRHYWEVDWNQIGRCGIGVAYPDIKRKGRQSGIMYTDKSWCLIIRDTVFKASHNLAILTLTASRTCPTLGVFLDYEAGRLSFYELCDPIRHLHTFTASFTEPLHVMFCVEKGASVTIRS